MRIDSSHEKSGLVFEQDFTDANAFAHIGDGPARRENKHMEMQRLIRSEFDEPPEF
jgi:hypothetical protein